jgi:hypothetical protein
VEELAQQSEGVDVSNARTKKKIYFILRLAAAVRNPKPLSLPPKSIAARVWAGVSTSAA